MTQYCIMSLYVASLPGNMFANGILFGAAETASMFLSSFLMSRFFDMTVLYTCYTMTAMSYLIFIFFPQVGLHSYVATVVSVCGLGVWQNVAILIMEMRVPPMNLGSVAFLARTMAVGLSVIAPSVSIMTPPMPFFILFGIATFTFMSSFLLPPPGAHLPQVERTGENSVKIIDKATEQATLAFNNSIMTPLYAQHSFSFNQSYTERVLGVSRPQMNETSLDP